MMTVELVLKVIMRLLQIVVLILCVVALWTMFKKPERLGKKHFVSLLLAASLYICIFAGAAVYGFAVEADPGSISADIYIALIITLLRFCIIPAVVLWLINKKLKR